MEVKVFSVYDVKTAAYGQPFFSPTRASAQRAFIGACSDRSTMLGQHPQDFRLFELGTFDDQSGLLSSINPDFVMEGVSNAQE